MSENNLDKLLKLTVLNFDAVYRHELNEFTLIILIVPFINPAVAGVPKSLLNRFEWYSGHYADFLVTKRKSLGRRISLPTAEELCNNLLYRRVWQLRKDIYSKEWNLTLKKWTLFLRYRCRQQRKGFWLKWNEFGHHWIGFRLLWIRFWHQLNGFLHN